MKNCFLTLFLTFTIAGIAQANEKTMDDVGPTNPTATNRFPGVRTQPKKVSPNQGAVLHDKNVPPMPTASPSDH
jgi:hypothetical protein